MNNKSKSKIAKNGVLRFLKEYTMLIIGSVIITTGTYFFVLPCKLVAGGVGGITNVLFYWFNWPTSIVSIVLQIPLIVLALILLKKEFAIKTLFATIVYSLFMRTYETLFPLVPTQTPSSILLWLVFGGMLTGIGIVIAYWAGGSNGGSEIVSNIVISKNPDYKIGKVLLIFNYCVYTLAFICFITLDKGVTLTSVLRILYSIFMSYVVSITTNIINHGIDPLLQYYIVSDKYDEISQALTATFKRGVTSIETIDNKRSNEEKKVLIVVIQHRQNDTLKNIIRSIDPNCFAYCKAIDSVVTRPDFKKRYR